MKTRSSWSASPTASPPATATSRTPQGLQGGRAARRGPLLFGGMASRGFAMQRPFRGLVVAGLPLLASRCGGLSGALPVRAARAARGRSARLAAPGAPPGLRPGWREPTRSTAEPTAVRAENRAPPRRARGCRLGAGFGLVPRLRGAETAGVHGLRGDRRSARRGPRVANARSAGAAWGNAVDLVVSADRPRMGPAATEGPQAGEPKAPRQGPEDHRRKQPRSKGKPCGSAQRMRFLAAPTRAYPRPGGGRAAISRAKAFRASQSGARSGTREASGESARSRPSPRAGSRRGAGL